jgi:hypothetical protein
MKILRQMSYDNLVEGHINLIRHGIPQLGIHVVTLYNWRKSWQLKGEVGPASEKDPQGSQLQAHGGSEDGVGQKIGAVPIKPVQHGHTMRSVTDFQPGLGLR